uniref:Uncharacterized protein n=1 Tax=Babesia bovis TaxID=5865 RepID=S6BHZ3_BABBO|nr:hypothetical protein [Babesia bovis]
MSSTSARSSGSRPSYRLQSPSRKVTFSQTCEVIPRSSEAHSKENEERDDDNATLEIILFLVTIILPFIGCIIFIKRKNARKTSRQYQWAYRALQLGTFLSVVYSFILCSLLHQYKLQSSEGDILGYSYVEIKDAVQPAS